MRVPPVATWPALACLAAAGYCAVRALIAYNGLGSLATAALVVVGAPVVLAVLGRLVRGVVHGGHRVVVETHRHGGDEPGEDVRTHEAGHWVTGRALGGHGGYAQANPDGSGVVVMYHRKEPTIVERVAISRAGAMAEGSNAGAQFDQAITKAALRRAPHGDRARLKREGEQLAARILSSNAGKVRKVAKSLRTGSHR